VTDTEVRSCIHIPYLPKYKVRIFPNSASETGKGGGGGGGCLIVVYKIIEHVWFRYSPKNLRL
jgi:hypothetical protein